MYFLGTSCTGRQTQESSPACSSFLVLIAGCLTRWTRAFKLLHCFVEVKLCSSAEILHKAVYSGVSCSAIAEDGSFQSIERETQIKAVGLFSPSHHIGILTAFISFQPFGIVIQSVFSQCSSLCFSYNKILCIYCSKQCDLSDQLAAWRSSSPSLYKCL